MSGRSASARIDFRMRHWLSASGDGLGQGVVDEVAVAAGGGGGEADEALGGPGLGGGEGAFELLDEVGDHRGGRGVSRG